MTRVTQAPVIEVSINFRSSVARLASHAAQQCALCIIRTSSVVFLRRIL